MPADFRKTRIFPTFTLLKHHQIFTIYGKGELEKSLKQNIKVKRINIS